MSGAEALVLVTLLVGLRRERIGGTAARLTLLGLTLAELARFGFGLNPAIEPALDRPLTPLLAELQGRIGRSGRIIGLGAEFAPNTLMRYGLLDPRNYDSVETRRNLDWFRPIYDPAVEAQTSRREITWDRLDRARDRLADSGVRAVVGPTPPPPSFRDVARRGAVWVAWLDASPLVGLAGPGKVLHQVGGDGRFAVELLAEGDARLVIRETFDPGWWATVDGRSVPITPYRDAFLEVAVGPGPHRVELRYDPIEVHIAALISGLAGLCVVFALTGSLRFRSTRSVVPRLGRTQAFGLESDSTTLPG